jgi:prepilin-type processing-associated H-X9-DG protein
MDNDSAQRPALTWRHALEPALLAASVLLVGVIVVLHFGREWFGPRIGSGDAAPRTRCLNNIRNLGLGLINYAAGNNGVLPPAWNVDKQGQPLQSWRLSVVGYLDEPAIARAYHPHEPWNSPFNSQFAERELSVMRCPEDISRTTDTSCMVVVGPRTAFPGAKPRKLKEIEDHDGLTNTITIVETAESGVNWSEPREIAFDDALRGINIPGVLTLSSRHNGVVMVSFADGHALPISDKIDPAMLKQLLQIDDGGPKEFP